MVIAGGDKTELSFWQNMWNGKGAWETGSGRQSRRIMVMTIQHNIEAMNANRQMNITGGTLAKSARNLSSGYKINVAADDAAGLSISEKMRRQIRGLSQGVQNTEDSVSLCQVADGALSEVHDMLQRINELAIKAANDTNSESDRRCINDEVTQILAEIDRIGDTTKFNEIFIFRGMEKKTMTKFLTVGLDNNITVSKPNTVPTPPFDQINMDCELTAGPFGPGNTGNHLDLAAKSTQQGSTNRWNLIFGSGSTSSPKLVGSYTPAGTTSICSFTVNFSNMTPTSYSASVVNNENVWSRTFSYQMNDVDMEIVQSVTMHEKDADSQYYTINYEVRNNSGVSVTYNLVHHEDTAYNNNDVDESYHTGGNRIDTSTIYTTNTGLANGINNPNVSTSVPSDFSIILNENGRPKALSFTENIVLNAGDNGAVADTLIVGNFSSVGTLENYTTDTMSGVLGQNTHGMDLGFSLVWSNKTLAAGASGVYSFNQGIVRTESDTNIPADTEKLPTTNGAPTEKTIKVKKNYIGGNQQLWVQSGNDALDGMALHVDAMNTGVLDIDDISVLMRRTAEDAINRVSDAIAKISKQRGLIGAYQNRLEHTIANENNIVENTTAAESQIRDTDMAKEMVQYSNKNIMFQAGQSMLSQANQLKQGILSLLAA